LSNPSKTKIMNKITIESQTTDNGNPLVFLTKETPTECSIYFCLDEFFVLSRNTIKELKSKIQSESQLVLYTNIGADISIHERTLYGLKIVKKPFEVIEKLIQENQEK
jgi:hypothetical protein